MFGLHRKLGKDLLSYEQARQKWMLEHGWHPIVMPSCELTRPSSEICWPHVYKPEPKLKCAYCGGPPIEGHSCPNCGAPRA